LAEFIANTSPLQYLHLLGCLEFLSALADRVFVPPAVVDELAAGHALGLDLPDLDTCDWITLRAPADTTAVRRAARLGAGETEVLALGLETPGAVVLLDDKSARRAAAVLSMPFRGTLGLLLDAKSRGLVPEVGPFLTQLSACGFRLSAEAAREFLFRAGETV
jgi:predicted nucleic acid-binding protein